MELSLQTCLSFFDAYAGNISRYISNVALPVMLIEMLVLILLRWGAWRQVVAATLVASLAANFFAIVVDVLLRGDGTVTNNVMSWLLFVLLHSESLRMLKEKNDCARIVVSLIAVTFLSFMSLMSNTGTVTSLLLLLPPLACLMLISIPFACMKAMSMALNGWDTFERSFWFSTLSTFLSSGVVAYYAVKPLSGGTLVFVLLFALLLWVGDVLVLTALQPQRAGWRLIGVSFVASATAALSAYLVAMCLVPHLALGWVTPPLLAILLPCIAMALTALGWNNFARSYRNIFLSAIPLCLVCPFVPSEFLISLHGLSDPAMWLCVFGGSSVAISLLRMHSLRFIWFLAVFAGVGVLALDTAATPHVIAPPFILFFASMLPAFFLELASSRLQSGDFDQAERYFNHSCALEQLVGPQPALVACALEGIGDIHLNRNQWLQAEQNYRLALGLVREEIGEGDKLIASLLVRLRLICFLHNRLGEAADLERQLQDFQERNCFGEPLPEPPQIASMSQQQWRTMQWQKNEDCLFGVSWRLAGVKLVATFLCPALLAFSAYLSSLADSDKMAFGREALCRQSLAIQELISADGLEAAAGHERLGAFYKDRGAYLPCRNELKRALTIREALLSASARRSKIEPIELMNTKKQLVFLSVYFRDGDTVAALKSIVDYHRALETLPASKNRVKDLDGRQSKSEFNREQTAFYELVLGEMFMGRGNMEEARTVLSSAYKFYREHQDSKSIPSSEMNLVSPAETLYQGNGTAWIKCAQLYHRVLTALNRHHEALIVHNETSASASYLSRKTDGSPPVLQGIARPVFDTIYHEPDTDLKGPGTAIY